MSQLITGIHHVTALAGRPQKNIDFYAGILGLRLVKKTVNFDAPEVYHFYYGDEMGHPGSIMTFFPYGDIMKGRHGKGMLNTTTFSVPLSSLDYWQQRFQKFNIEFENEEDTKLTVRLYCLNGKLISSSELQIKKGVNKISYSPNGSLTAGMYVLQVINENNRILKTDKLIIQ